MQSAGLHEVGTDCGKGIAATYRRKWGCYVQIGERTAVKHVVGQQFDVVAKAHSL